ncbi:polyprenyl synthetase family protein [Methanoculleus horonobensis]|jgi:geranylgeranyl diphosphate synthase type II|uniref:polyprenyl synthetase family protein n=1 Tax=Methanoculleus horonobensis TaxID=528314 RepID=UPI0008338934|nr:polyprenyl synthetase family protein [Methanoculleus horonobensis]MDD3070693.1 polyprenyl synthetase family protein [Methanoculleus horonobensis]MDD4252614.1 polyprenyl synthetase family protein [Methanoculleus horonobensis]
MIPFREFLPGIRPAVNRRIAETAGSEADIDPGVLPLLLKGKRMRAGLLLYIHAGLAPAAPPTRQALDLACAVELAHAASLILDDMLDGDTARRGAPSLHLTRGQGRAVLDAVGILALPYSLAAPYGAGYVTMLASAQRKMARGVTWEMLGGPDLPPAELYDTIVARKTGCLFSLAAAWGAMATGEEGAVVTAFGEFGLAAGKAMQVADDIADLSAAGAGVRGSRPGSEALLLRCVPENNGTRQALGRILEREVSGAAARIAAAGRCRVPPEAWEPFGQAVREIVGLTMGEEVPVG